MAEITLLGGQAVVDPVTERILTRSSRSIALLGYLVAHAGVPQSRSVIAGSFWPDSSEAQALTNLRRELHQLRLVLGDDEALEVTPTHLSWHDGDRHRVDLATFVRAHAATVVASDDDAVVRHGTTALAAYTGDLLPGLDDPWVDDARARVRGLCVDACDRVHAAAERTGRLDIAADAMRKRISVDPYDEPAYRTLMELQAALGDRAGAVRTYHRLSDLLESELGVEPDPMTTEALDRVTGASRSDRPADRSVRPGPAPAALVGRDAELEVLLDAWRRAAKGLAGVALIGGGAGVGKTRLANELAARVRRGGAVVAVSQCFESSGRISLNPVSDWLRTPEVAAARSRVDHVWRREAERLLPVDGERMADAAGDRHDLWQQARFFEGVARTLLAVDAPTLLVLDNLQWCDRDTLDFVSAMLNLAPRAPVLLAATTRPDSGPVPADPAAPVTWWLDGLRRAGLLSETWLEPFDVAGTAQLAESLTGSRPADPAAGELHEATGGFPLFVVEAVRAGHAVGPEILRKRLQQTSVTAQEVAGLAAALGRDFTLPLLVEASDLEPDAVVLAVDELWRHRILRENGTGYDFSHDLLRTTAYDAVTKPRRWLLHRRLAQALELLHAGRQDAVAAQLAEQYHLAGNHDRALTYYVRAAASTSEVFAHSETLALLDRAFGQLDALPAGRQRDETEISCRVLAAQTLLALRGFAPAEMEYTLRRIHELAERLGRREDQVTALAALFGTMFVRGRMKQALEIGRTAVALVRPGDARYGQAHFALGGAALHIGMCEVAFDAFETAYATVTRDELMSFLVRAPVFCGSWYAQAAWARGLPDRADQLARAAVAEARTSGHVPSLALGLAYGAITQQLLGNVEDCGRFAHEALTVCQRYRLSYYSEWGRILLGWCRGEAGAEQIRTGIENLRQADVAARMPYWLALLADVTPDRGQADALLADAVAAAVEHEECWWLPDLWRRQAVALPDGGAVPLLERAASLAVEQGNIGMLERCRSELAARHA